MAGCGELNCIVRPHIYMVVDRGECELHGYMRRGRFGIFWSLGGGMGLYACVVSGLYCWLYGILYID
jgi:hypothetical protein